MEDVPFGEGVVSVAGLKRCQRPIRDVFAAVCAIFVVGVEGEALKTVTRRRVYESRGLGLSPTC